MCVETAVKCGMCNYLCYSRLCEHFCLVQSQSMAIERPFSAEQRTFDEDIYNEKTRDDLLYVDRCVCVECGSTTEQTTECFFKYRLKMINWIGGRMKQFVGHLSVAVSN